MTFTDKETLELVVSNKMKEPNSWPNMTSVLVNTVVFGKLSLQEEGKLAKGSVGLDQPTLDYLMTIFDSLDAQFGLIEKLDDLIDFKKIFGGFFGGIIEKTDKMFIRALLKYVIFPLILSFFSRNKTIDITN